MMQPAPRATQSLFNLDKEDEIKLDKSNILLIGPSGVGKTYITQVLGQILDGISFILCSRDYTQKNF